MSKTRFGVLKLLASSSCATSIIPCPWCRLVLDSNNQSTGNMLDSGNPLIQWFSKFHSHLGLCLDWQRRLRSRSVRRDVPGSWQFRVDASRIDRAGCNISLEPHCYLTIELANNRERTYPIEIAPLFPKGLYAPLPSPLWVLGNYAHAITITYSVNIVMSPTESVTPLCRP